MSPDASQEAARHGAHTQGRARSAAFLSPNAPRSPRLQLPGAWATSALAELGAPTCTGRTPLNGAHHTRLPAELVSDQGGSGPAALEAGKFWRNAGLSF